MAEYIDVEIIPDFTVEAHVQQWTIVSDNIYIVNKSETPPQWYVDMINDSVDFTDINTQISDHQDNLDQLGVGYTNLITITDDQTSQITYLASADADKAASILNLQITKITADEAIAISNQSISAWQTSGAAGAWFTQNIKAVSSSTAANTILISEVAAEVDGVSASVTRVEEAVVDTMVPNPLWVGPGDPDAGGETQYITVVRAKSSLMVEADGSIAGFVAASDGSVSTFDIRADIFRITDGTISPLNPFTIDTVTDPGVPQIAFNGVVSFSNVTGTDGLVYEENLTNGVTVIDGSNITTGYISADRLDVNEINAMGITAENIVSTAVISGNRIEGSVIEGAVIKASYLDLDGELEVLTNYHITVAMYNSSPSFYADSIPIYGTGDSSDIVSEYRIPTLSLISDTTKSVSLPNVGNSGYSSISSYKTANVGNNIKCVKIRPVFELIAEYTVSTCSAFHSYCDKTMRITVDVYLGAIKIFTYGAGHENDCSGSPTGSTFLTNYYGTGIGWTTFSTSTGPHYFTSAGIDFKISASIYYGTTASVIMLPGVYTSTVDISNTGPMMTVTNASESSATQGNAEASAGFSQYFSVRNLS